ncbi:MAG: M48 family metalloprotease [Proteobacteria bacterium]|nr:M48 family metalloprotease [Pseudomonadota bacterium]
MRFGRTEIARHGRRLLGSVLAGMVAFGPMPAAAQQRMNYVRDAEVESLLRDYLNPLLKAAGQPTSAVRILLVDDRQFNAFVSPGRRMTIFSGAIIDTNTPNELIGVMAHETGHIAGGHLARLSQALPKAMAIGILGSLLGAGALVGASNSRQVGMGGAAPMGMLLGGQELAMRSLLSYQRTEEQAADRAAINYLNATRQSGKGLVDTMRRIADQQMFLASRVDKYLLSHPLATDRIAAIDDVARSSPYYESKDSPGLNQRHQLARAKLVAFTGRQDEIYRRYPQSDNSLQARYARAILAHRFNRGSDAQSQIDGLIASQPRNPYFWELKGQNLLENGQATQAIAPLKKAVSLAPGQPLLRVILGHALMASNTPANVDQSIKELTVAIQRDREVAEAYFYLAQAYEKRGRTGDAELITAEGYFMAGAYDQAQLIARRAQQKFEPNSAGWRRANDIITFKKDQG